jgi:hypothetical protein
MSANNTAIVQQNTWAIGTKPGSLSEIFAHDIHVAIWERPTTASVESYFANTFDQHRCGIRDVYALTDLKLKLLDRLPDGTGKLEVIDDIYLLADMLTCLFDCNEVGLRLSAIINAMCPRFHTDHIPVRMVCTYLGNGTQWIKTDRVDHNKLGHGAKGKSDEASGLIQSVNDIEQMSAFDVGLLKGSAWENDRKQAAVHRSCPHSLNEQRVILSLDPM